MGGEKSASLFVFGDPDVTATDNPSAGRKNLIKSVWKRIFYLADDEFFTGVKKKMAFFPKRDRIEMSCEEIGESFPVSRIFDKNRGGEEPIHGVVGYVRHAR